jgi:hypothetical protein
MMEDNISLRPIQLVEAEEEEVGAMAIAVVAVVAVEVRTTTASRRDLAPSPFVKSARKKDTKPQDVGTDMMKMKKMTNTTRQLAQLPLTTAMIQIGMSIVELHIT